MLFCCAYLLSHVWLFAAPWTVACQAPPSMGDSPGKNTGVGCHALFQGILPTWGSNSGLPHCRQILYHLSHQRSPRIWERVAYPFSRGSSQSRNRTGVSCIAGESFTSWATREAVSGSYGNSSFIFVWNFHTIFHSSCTIYIHTNSIEGFLFTWFLSCVMTKYFILKVCVSWSESIKGSTFLSKIVREGQKEALCYSVCLFLCTAPSQSNSPLIKWV